MNWPGRRREEGGSEHIAQIRVIQVLPVADSWIDEDEVPKNPSSEVPKFRELQVPNFQVPGTSSSEILKKKLTKNCFFPFQQKTF